MNLFQFQNPLRLAKQRTGRNGLGVSISRGLFNVVEVEYLANGRSQVTYLVNRVSADVAIAFIDRLGLVETCDDCALNMNCRLNQSEVSACHSKQNEVTQ